MSAEYKTLEQQIKELGKTLEQQIQELWLSRGMEVISEEFRVVSAGTYEWTIRAREIKKGVK